MKYKSNLVAQASGALGGKVASRNKGGDYFRRRALPTNPRTQLQVDVRTGFGTLSQFYGQVLTDDQRSAWTTYGANVLIPDRLGDPRQQSGIAAYVRANAARIQARLPVINDAPTVFALGTTPLYLLSVTGSAGAKNLVITVRNPDQFTVTDNVFVYLGRPKGPGVAYFKGPYRFQDIFQSDSFPAEIPFSSMKQSYSTGQRLFVRLTASMTDGRYSTPGDSSIIVPAGVVAFAEAEAAPAARSRRQAVPAAPKEHRRRLPATGR